MARGGQRGNRGRGVIESTKSWEVITESSEETHLVGKKLGEALSPNAIVTLHGDLGAGKTTFIRGLSEGVLQGRVPNFASPTFSLLNIYDGLKTIFHFDLYRLPRAEEFIAAGFDEYFCAGGICCIEWADKIASLIPPHSIDVSISYLAEQKRKILIREF